jgi:hypothetical protein
MCATPGDKESTDQAFLAFGLPRMRFSVGVFGRSPLKRFRRLLFSFLCRIFFDLPSMLARACSMRNLAAI